VEKLLNDMNKPLTMMQIHYIVKEALTALEYLHDRIKICHRDLKGANLFIADDLSVKIANFTLSAKCDSSSKKHIIAPKAPHFIALEVLKTGYYFVRSPHFMGKI
jgi:serine/threonine protein kinase